MIKKFEDIDIIQKRHPLIEQLEIQLINAKPKNAIYFIKKWAKKKLRQSLESDNDQADEKDQQIDNQSQKNLKRQEQSKYKRQYKRRNAIIMARIEFSQNQGLLSMKKPLQKNEQCKSRIMISLRSISFLKKLTWEDINNLVVLSNVREYYRQQIFIKKDDLVHFLYIVINGEVVRKNNNVTKKYIQGQSMMEESIVSLIKSLYNYEIISEKSWICSILSHNIHEMIIKSNKKTSTFYQKVIMNISLFSILDLQERDKLLNMIKEHHNTKQDQIIVEKDQPIGKIFIVVSGQFEKCKKSLSGQILSYLSFRQGQHFGEQWLTTSRAQSEYLVVCKSEGILASIDKADIERGICSIDYMVYRKKMKKKIL